MDNRQLNPISAPLRSFQDKMSYFYAFNGIFFVWTIMALLYFIYNTLNVSCSGMQHFFIAWTCSYGFEALVPLVCIYSGREAKHYMTSYVFLALATIFKLAVLGSLIVGAWQPIGLCYIPSTYKLIIVLINSLEIVCLLIDMVLIVRIKAVNRQILIERLMTSKTFAES